MNAPSGMVVMLSGKVMEVRPLQLEHTQSPILVNEAGKESEVIREHERRAWAPIVVRASVSVSASVIMSE